MQRSMIDYAINALLVLYVALMAAWFALLVTGSLSVPATIGFGAITLPVVLGWHLLKRKRNALQRTL